MKRSEIKQMVNDTKDIILKLRNNGYITKNTFDSYYRKSNDKTLKFALESQFDYTIEDIKLFYYNLFSKFDDEDKVFRSDEIVILNIMLNKKGIRSKQQLLKKTRFINSRLTRALNGLIDEGVVGVVCMSQNGRLYFLRKDYILEVLKK